MAKSDSVFIKPEQHSTAKRWEMPQVQGPLPGQVEADQIRPPTAEELKKLHQQAQEDGFRNGYQKGHEQGYAEGHEKGLAVFNQRAEVLRRLMINLDTPLQDLDSEVQQSMVDLITLISRHIVRRELRTDPGEIVAAVREAMGMLPIGARHPRIYLNPEDVEIVREALSLGEEERSWKLESDPLISRGGCMVETQSSFIDATIENRLSAAVAKMLGGERESDHS